MSKLILLLVFATSLVVNATSSEMPDLHWLITQKILQPKEMDSANVMIGNYREARYFHSIEPVDRPVVIFDWGDTEVRAFYTDTRKEIDLDFAQGDGSKDVGYHFFDLADNNTLRLGIIPNEDGELVGIDRKSFRRVLIDQHLTQIHSSVVAYKELFQKDLDFGNTRIEDIFSLRLVPAMTLNGSYKKTMVILGVDRGSSKILDVYQLHTMGKISRTGLSSWRDLCGAFLLNRPLTPIQFRSLSDSTILTLE